MTKLKITESDIIRAVNDYLQIQRNKKKLMFIRNNSGAIPIVDGKNKRRYIRFGDKGSPDFLVWLPYNNEMECGFIPMCKWMRGLALEAKSDIGKQSIDQIEWQADFEKLGGEYYIIRSIEELIKIIS
jgi:hypothetical protein